MPPTIPQPTSNGADSTNKEQASTDCVADTSPHGHLKCCVTKRITLTVMGLDVRYEVSSHLKADQDVAQVLEFEKIRFNLI